LDAAFPGSNHHRRQLFVQDYSLYYAPSLTVLNEMTLRKQNVNSVESLLAFGNPVIAQDKKLKYNLHPIPDAEAELAGCGRSCPSPR
jgi:hypothetical protein